LRELEHPDRHRRHRLVEAGAGLVGRRGYESFCWVTLTDPDGNQFCVAEQTEAEGEDASS
jgi:hypothetical protein